MKTRLIPPALCALLLSAAAAAQSALDLIDPGHPPAAGDEQSVLDRIDPGTQPDATAGQSALEQISADNTAGKIVKWQAAEKRRMARLEAEREAERIARALAKQQRLIAEANEKALKEAHEKALREAREAAEDAEDEAYLAQLEAESEARWQRIFDGLNNAVLGAGAVARGDAAGFQDYLWGEVERHSGGKIKINPSQFYSAPQTIGGKCQAGIDRAGPAIERILAQSQSSDAISAQVCATLRMGIVAEWSNLQCANDPSLDATRRQQSRQQARIQNRYNHEYLVDFKRHITNPGSPKYCDLESVRWTGLVLEYQ